LSKRQQLLQMEIGRVRDMTSELLMDESDRMTEWELEFVESVARWLDNDGVPSQKQRQKVEEVWDRVFG
jgi:hypothetical protein